MNVVALGRTLYNCAGGVGGGRFLKHLKNFFFFVLQNHMLVFTQFMFCIEYIYFSRILIYLKLEYLEHKNEW